ncbi:MAG: hypothetical protein ABSG92_09465 [Conexivisphaerales archaeon]
MKVGRFQVMATLQAARAYVLGLPLESALSWGLNRSIFYAAAKRGFKGGSEVEGRGARGKGTSKGADTYFLGDEMAFKQEKGEVLRFTIGGKVQTDEDFERQIEARFSGSFPQAWKEALSYVKGFDRNVLLSGEGFFREVYRPRRDELAEKWTEMSKGA